MRRLHREVKSYKEYNERIMKAREEIIQILNMFQKKFNKDSGTKKETSYILVTTTRYQSKMDDHGNDRK
jgi:F0F1-type ATP synthase gamma subunit